MEKLSSSTQAYLNEVKGNLFEFLVASELSKKSGIESSFLKNVDIQLRSLLKSYEAYLKANDSMLVTKLKRFAEATANKVFENINFKIESVLVIGKMKGKEFTFLDELKETDIVVLGEQKEFLISLKLSKKNAFVNTKSGGMKSFVKRYFANFERAKLFQATLNSLVDLEFEKMAKEMHQFFSLPYGRGFDDNWTLTRLPGELPAESKSILANFYNILALNLFDILKELFDEDPMRFKKNLFSLMGHSNNRIAQVYCFYTHRNDKRYEFDRVEINFPLNSHEVFFGERPKSKTSFDIVVGDKVLQLRVKPMNQFTTASYKVNCSVKDRKETKRYHS